MFKKLMKKIKGLFQKKEKKQEAAWYNQDRNSYDPKTGTPNGEAYISPDSAYIGLSKHN